MLIYTNRSLKSAWREVETEELIIAAHDYSRPTRNYPASMIKNKSNPTCRLCDQKIESVDQLVSCNPILIVIDHKERYNKIRHIVHWKVYKYYWILDCEKWYKHYPEPITESKRATIFWNLAIQTHWKIKSYWPYILVKGYKRKTNPLMIWQS